MQQSHSVNAILRNLAKSLGCRLTLLSIAGIFLPVTYLFLGEVLLWAAPSMQSLMV